MSKNVDSEGSLDLRHRVDAAHEDHAPRDPKRELPEALLLEHARELVERLQQWSDDLDRREAELHAKMALLEHQQRHQRLQSQSLATERNEQDRAIQRQRQELAETLRRGAEILLQVYGDDGPGASEPWEPPTSGQVGWLGLSAEQLRDLAVEDQTRAPFGS